MRLKKYSNKPFSVTTRDAVIVTVVTVVVTLLCLFLYTLVDRDTKPDYIAAGLQAAFASIAAQYFYEYSGINNMLAESSMRYARGSTLSQYAGRRSALLCDVYSALERSKYVETPGLKDRYLQLKTAVDHPNGKLPVPEFILDHLTSEAACDMMVNGFDGWTTVPRFLVFSQLSQTAINNTNRGEKILEEVGFYIEDAE